MCVCVCSQLTSVKTSYQRARMAGCKFNEQRLIDAYAWNVMESSTSIDDLHKHFTRKQAKSKERRDKKRMMKEAAAAAATQASSSSSSSASASVSTSDRLSSDEHHSGRGDTTSAVEDSESDIVEYAAPVTHTAAKRKGKKSRRQKSELWEAQLSQLTDAAKTMVSAADMGPTITSMYQFVNPNDPHHCRTMNKVMQDGRIFHLLWEGGSKDAEAWRKLCNVADPIPAVHGPGITCGITMSPFTLV